MQYFFVEFKSQVLKIQLWNVLLFFSIFGGENWIFFFNICACFLSTAKLQAHFLKKYSLWFQESEDAV